MEDGGVAGKYYVRLIEVPGPGLMAAIVDAEELGRVEEDPSTGVRIEASPGFYKGELVAEDVVKRVMVEADILVLTGARVIGIAVEMGFVNPDSVMDVNGLKHVQVYKFKF